MTRAAHARPRPRVARAATLAAVALGAGLAWATAPAAPPDDWTPPGDALDRPDALVPEDALRDRLGGIDYVPARAELDPLLGSDPAATLLELATSDEPVDPGVRLRALRALAQYPGDATTAALIDTIGALQTNDSGTKLLLLDAAMRSLAVAGGEDAVDVLAPVLAHASKDTRAAAARALGATRAKGAADHLYERLAVEPDAFVRLALSDAIRALGENMQ